MIVAAVVAVVLLGAQLRGEGWRRGTPHLQTYLLLAKLKKKGCSSISSINKQNSTMEITKQKFK